MDNLKVDFPMIEFGQCIKIKKKSRTFFVKNSVVFREIVNVSKNICPSVQVMLKNIVRMFFIFLLSTTFVKSILCIKKIFFGSSKSALVPA